MWNTMRRRSGLVAIATLFAGTASVLSGAAPAAAADSCTHATANNDDGYVIVGAAAPLRKGAYGSCDAVQTLAANTKLWTWCTVENSYGNEWIYGRIDGTQTYGWLWLDHASQVVDDPTVNEGWCPGEAAPDPAAIDGTDTTEEPDPVVDTSEIFDAGADAAAEPVAGPEDGTEPDADFVAAEGATETVSALEVTAQAKLKYGAAIKRATVIKRAKNWYNRNVPYNQGATAWDMNHGKRYRTDCSGFVSMTWALKSSRTTSTLDDVSHKVKWSKLKAGDMVLRAGHHVQLFEKWANSKHTKFWIYEEGSTASDMNHYKVAVSTAKNNGYKPYRYDKIVA